MSATAQSVIRRAVETLQDETSVRWTIGELARAKFDAAIAAHAVDAFMGHAGQVPRARVSWF